MERLPPKLLDEIKQRIVRELHPVSLYLFGSHAWGSPSEDSDIDILLVLERIEGRRAEYMRRAYRSIRDLRVPAEFVVKSADEFERQKTVAASLVHRVLERGRPL